MNRQYVTCDQCGSIHLWPLPLIEANEAFESDTSARAMATTDDRRLAYLARRLSLLTLPALAQTSNRPRLLDVGCSTGRLMQLAQTAGWNVTGLEMSASLAAEAGRHLPGSTVITGDILKTDPGDLGKFHAVTALDVIEHVLDPAEFLQRLYDLLLADGQLLLHTPNASSLRARVQRDRWNMLIPEYHFHLFTPHGLVSLLEATGFAVTHLSTGSGSGTETGLAALIARAKESLLNTACLGNAIVLVARKLK